MTMGEKEDLHFSPLYEHVKQAILGRIIAGEWAPGALLPSEQALAVEYGVSQGTLRKALNSLTEEKRLVRHQGKGTAVAMLSEQDEHFSFMHLNDRSGRRVISFQCHNFSLRADLPDEKERESLALGPKDEIIRLDRVRIFDNKPAINERVTVVAGCFPGLRSLPCDSIPSRLYAFYQSHFGITIARALETIEAVEATAEDSERLAIKIGEPLLQVARVSFDLRGKPLEFRLSHITTRDYVYANESR